MNVGTQYRVILRYLRAGFALPDACWIGPTSQRMFYLWHNNSVALSTHAGMIASNPSAPFFPSRSSSTIIDDFAEASHHPLLTCAPPKFTSLL